MTDKIVVLSTCETEEEARRLARTLVERHVAACVTITNRVTSVYYWQGSVQEDTEWLLVIKSRRDLFASLARELRSIHTYQVPEIIALPVVDGSEDYLEWIDRELAADEETGVRPEPEASETLSGPG